MGLVGTELVLDVGSMARDSLRPLVARNRPMTSRPAAPLELNLLRQSQSVIHLDTEIADGCLDFSVAK